MGVMSENWRGDYVGATEDMVDERHPPICHMEGVCVVRHYCGQRRMVTVVSVPFPSLFI